MWLNNHATVPTYNAHPIKVKDLCTSNATMSNFANLTTSKNIVLLTKSSVGAELQASFFHSVVGVPILSEDMHHVPRISMSTGSSMEVSVNSLFQLTEATHQRPDLKT